MPTALTPAPTKPFFTQHYTVNSSGSGQTYTERSPSPNYEISFFIATGSLEQPVVSMEFGSNVDGTQSLCSFAKAATNNGGDNGIWVLVFFKPQTPGNAWSFGVVVGQPGVQGWGPGTEPF
jgi:hypothetical protein